MRIEPTPYPPVTAERKPSGVLGHTPECPGRYTDPCTCGGGLPVMTPGPAQGASPLNVGSVPTPPPTGESPYADVEYARSLVKRAESLATESPDLARFLLEIATEARLLAELQGRWEYAS